MENQLSFLDFFGNTEGFSPIESKKATEKKASEKKAAQKKEATKKELFKRPISCVSGYNAFVITGEGEVSLDELKEEIFAAQKMFAPKITKVDVKDGKATVKFKSLPRPDLKLVKPYTVVLNGFETEITPDADEEDEAKDLAEAAEAAWLEQYPDFKGCSFIADEVKGIVVPVMVQNVTDSLELPLEYEVFGGEKGKVTEEDCKTVEGKALYTEVCSVISLNLGIKCGLFKAESGRYYAVPDTDGTETGKNSNSAKSKEKMIKTNCTVVFYGERVTITPETFGGKEEISEKEFLKWICSPEGGGHDEFGPDRGSWIDFDDKRKLAIPRFPAARKGACSIENVDGVEWRVQKTPLGVFHVLNNVKGESPANDFRYMLPKIPAAVWTKIVRFFV